MPQTIMAEKKRVEVDGNNIPGFIGQDELVIEDVKVEIPLGDRNVTAIAGVDVIPPVPMNFRLDRGSGTYEFLRDWKFNREIKDVTVIRTDGSGVESSRTLLEQCELDTYSEPAFDAAAPSFAQMSAVLLPKRIVPLDSV